MTTIPLYPGNSNVYYPTLSSNIYGEYIDYTFPIDIVPIQYEIGFSDNCLPVTWYVFGRKGTGDWTLLNSKSEFVQGAETINTKFYEDAVNNTLSYPITNQITVNSMRLHVSISTGTSIKVREFRVYDQYGRNIPFLVPFCTSTNSLYHSGSLNFSKIDSFSLDANLPTDFYAVGHDTIQLEHGMIK